MGSSSENKDLFFYFLRATDPGFKFHSTFTQSEGLPVLSIVRDVTEPWGMGLRLC